MKRCVVLAASTLLAGLVVAPTASGAETTRQVSPVASAERPALRANGIIVKTTASKRTIQRAAQASLAGDADVTRVRTSGDGRALVAVEEAIDAESAAEAAAELALRDDVEWAVPNYRFRASAAAPVVPNDPDFAEQTTIWDSTAVKPGGYSSKAPYAWQTTKGDDVVVAVVDSGVVLSHPELDGRLVDGYDFVSADDPDYDPPSAFYTANDGNGRDADPSDPGDWIPAGDDYCYGEEIDEQEDSSWHGTHVAGIVAAKQDNSIGITGIAPSAKVQPVRVLGRCGGDLFDIMDGISWAAGRSIDGVPDNTTPADVVNLSLGADFYGAPSKVVKQFCTAFNDVIDDASRSGALSVIASGNTYDNTLYDVPARCGSGIAVTATRDDGFLASYANAGKGVDIAAPGGDQGLGRPGVLSTVDSGTTTPQGASYAVYDGTSMAAPAVSAAAALLRSAGVPAKDLRTAVLKSVQPFPSSKAKKKVDVEGPWWVSQFRDLNCTTKRCGSGILDLSKAPLPVAPPQITGQGGVGQKLSVAAATWSSAAAPSVSYQWYLGETKIAKATKSTYTVPKSAFGQQISVEIRPKTSGFTALAQRSEPVLVTSGLTVTVPKSVPFGAAASVSVAVQDQRGAAPDVPVELLVDGSSIGTVRTSAKGKATFTVPSGLEVGSHSVVAVVNDSVASVASPPKDLVVAKVAPSVTQSVATSVRADHSVPLTITVKAANVPQPTGTLTIKDGKTTVLATVELGGADNGKIVYQLTLTKRGKHSITTSYSGNGVVAAKTSSAKTVTVK